MNFMEKTLITRLERVQWWTSSREHRLCLQHLTNSSNLSPALIYRPTIKPFPSRLNSIIIIYAKRVTTWKINRNEIVAISWQIHKIKISLPLATSFFSSFFWLQCSVISLCTHSVYWITITRSKMNWFKICIRWIMME